MRSVVSWSSSRTTGTPFEQEGSQKEYVSGLNSTAGLAFRAEGSKSGWEAGVGVGGLWNVGLCISD
jgi:hypothetical protein